ncbi:energy-coupling factor ABC transporter ATP-binding protein [Infirmifilum sp. NZ]|uniref:energy-coupling factor ABC transporter ATP-binding protein n=1 Tax=Infirmifilum sp. NZ TaxID=2926850 RepID=UPI0027A99788|nr:ABC transporter ATP-binding protein [Infirmifilum sp. NZ]UNQ72680.1 energy-coupling factor ABC transporter ATP-binding protein [Infirmifilum sp. NZ]
MEPVIKVEDVYYKYPDGAEALKGVNLSIASGEFVAIMGENGAGKTTLVKHFNGVLKPTGGRVLVKGMDTRFHSVAELSRIVGLVFQNPDHQLFGETVFDEVAFALKNFNFPRDVIERRAEWALKVMELYRYKDRSPYSLSVGERKRLAIAAVLAYDPEILVLDEPTAGQDYVQKEKISEMLNLLRTTGKTVVIVTHDVEFVVEHVNRIVVMSDGKILASASPREILSNYMLLRRSHLLPPQSVRLAKALLGENYLKFDFHRLDNLIRAIVEEEEPWRH